MNSQIILTFLLISLLIGCTSFNYVGETYSETEELQIFYSIQEIPVKHKVFGHIVGTPGLLEDFDLALENEAKQRGADAIVINEIDVEYSGDSSSRKIKATFIKYLE